MIVVSDTSPLQYLTHLKQFELLHLLYKSVFIPPAVIAEFAAGNAPADVNALMNAEWVSVAAPGKASLLAVLQKGLDPGETEAIALSIELKADLVLIDERAGTKAAAAFNLNTTGVLGVLLDAKKAGLVKAVKPFLLRLRDETNFRITQQLFESTLQLANEQ